MVAAGCYYAYVVSNKHYGHSMKFFASIMALIREEFPDLTFGDEAFDVFRVCRSSRVEGMWGLMFKLPLRTLRQDYQVVNQLPFSIQ